VCVCVYICGVCNMRMFVCVGFLYVCLCVLVICVLVFTAFCIVCTVLYCSVYVYLFLFFVCNSIRATATE
jgi:hypothetical protein